MFRSLNILGVLGCIVALFLLLAGCGGGGDGVGEVSGITFDVNGNLVRDARIWVAGGGETYSNSNGAYVLTRAPARNLLVRAEVVDAAGNRFEGSNMSRILNGERTKNVNITLVPESQVRRFVGRVSDSRGRRIRGAFVVARPADASVLSSRMAITDEEGRYELGGLQQGKVYEVVANALGFGDDTDELRAGVDAETQNFVLPSPLTGAPPAPAGVFATAYTMPAVLTRSSAYRSAVAAVKQELPRYRGKKWAAASKRTTIGGNDIEIDLVWDRPNSSDVLGYGVYRGRGTARAQVDYLRDPLAQIYADLDNAIEEGVSYTYWLTTLGTNYDSFSGAGESDFSNSTAVTPIGDLQLNSPNLITGTVRWQPCPGATRYTVYVYSVFPRIGETSIANNFADPVTVTQYTLPSSLVSGTRYYYLVMARNADDSAMSFSQVGEIVAP